ncbi:MAG TPA: pentapeptide repeat-containing protein [Longimicrobium sp.]|nr:pentapeptide repeat-containing protein [Longimicrobium sp.]
MAYDDLIIPAPTSLQHSLRAFAERIGGRMLPGHHCAIQYGDRVVTLVGRNGDASATDVAERLATSDVLEGIPGDVGEILVAVADAPWSGTATLRLGVRMVSLHGAVARLAGLPEGWRSTQDAWVEQTLEPVMLDGDIRLAELDAVEGHETSPATQYIDAWFRKDETGGQLLYLRAEAGKGKSTLLASTVRNRLATGVGPLPLYLPLRMLQRGAGVSWGEIAGRIGVVGADAQILAHAVREGLVGMALDGLDEVAGRYDPGVVRAILRVIQSELVGPSTRVILSGRTTEAGLLDPREARVVTIELPTAEDPAFREYVAIVVDDIVPKWPQLALRLPESLSGGHMFNDQPLTAAEAERISRWTELTFDDFGKDRSLFFVQSLACIARSYQLGKKALVIEPGAAFRDPESLERVCLLAAGLACVREQNKIEKSARHLFTPEAQLNLLTWLALRAAACTSERDALPPPAALAGAVLSIAPYEQHEEFTAVMRQLYKHALLFAGHGDGISGGDWKPQFLSEWVLGALLCEAWQRADAAPAGLDEQVVERAIATAERSRIAFQYLFAELMRRKKLRAPDRLVTLLRGYADEGSPEAASNYWTLVAGLGEGAENLVSTAPGRIPEMADLSDLTFEATALTQSFGGETVVLGNARFSGSSLENVRLFECDLTGAQFEGCSLADVEFVGCDGPILFTGCTFTRCTFRNTRSKALPALEFSSCSFDAETRIVQQEEHRPGAKYEPVVEFNDCTGDAPMNELLSGDWIGIDSSQVRGYQLAGEPTIGDPAEITLRSLLKTFFPRRQGADSQLQVRPYIRSSAIGRGSLPTGAPTDSELTDVLFAVGFTTGGREDHVYAPWSSVAGASTTGRELRNELAAFVREARSGPTVETMLIRLRRAASWPPSPGVQ